MIVGNNTLTAGRFSPRRIADLEFWCRGDAFVDVGGGVISELTDISGKGRNATQGTGSARGTLVTNASLRNRPGVSLDGGDWYSTAAFNLPRAVTLFFVLGALTARGMICEHGIANDGFYAYSVSAASAAVFGSAGVGYHRSRESPPALWAMANSQNAVVYDEVNPPVLRAARAVVPPTSTEGDAQTAQTLNKVLYIGCRGGSSLFHTGVLHELLIYSRALTASEIARIEAYLFGRYGV